MEARKRWLPWEGLMGLLLMALLSGATAAEKETLVKPPKVTGPQEAEVQALMLDPQSQQPVVMLQGKQDKRVLSMVIGLAEATSIAVPLQGVAPPRPLTHDLFLTLFGRMKVSLKRVVITDLKDDVYYALLYLDLGGTEVTLDSRPSDAIGLALRAKVPILVEDRVFDKAGSTAPRSTPTPHF
jgi:bifunctional DNase/RNase